MRVILLVALLAVFAFAAGKSVKQPAQLNKFDPKVFAKCLADKLGVTLDKAVGCALQCKTDVKCYPGCLGVDDKKKVIVAAIECALASKKAKKVAKKGTKVPKTKSPKTKKPKSNKTKKALAKMLNKKVSDKKKEGAKKQLKKIFKRLVAKAKRQEKMTALPLKAQLQIVKNKLAKRSEILKKILSKVTICGKKDDAEKKVLKKMLREFAAKDMLKVSAQQSLLKKVLKARKAKKAAKKGTKVPKTKSPKTKKPRKAGKKVAKKLSDSEGPYCDRCNAACEKVPTQYAEVREKCFAACKPVCDRSLSDSEFLGKFGRWLGGVAKNAGKAALGAAKDAAISAAVGAIA